MVSGMICSYAVTTKGEASQPWFIEMTPLPVAHLLSSETDSLTDQDWHFLGLCSVTEEHTHHPSAGTKLRALPAEAPEARYPRGNSRLTILEAFPGHHLGTNVTAAVKGTRLALTTYSGNSNKAFQLAVVEQRSEQVNAHLQGQIGPGWVV